MDDEKKYFTKGVERMQQPDIDAREKSMATREWAEELNKIEREIIQEMKNLVMSFEKGEINREFYDARVAELYHVIAEIDESYKRLNQAHDSHLKIRTAN